MVVCKLGNLIHETGGWVGGILINFREITGMNPVTKVDIHGYCETTINQKFYKRSEEKESYKHAEFSY